MNKEQGKSLTYLFSLLSDFDKKSFIAKKKKNVSLILLSKTRITEDFWLRRANEEKKIEIG